MTGQAVRARPSACLACVITRHADLVVESVVEIGLQTRTAVVIRELSENGGGIVALCACGSIDETLFAGIMALLTVIEFGVFCVA